jgi:hypothetical protein
MFKLSSQEIEKVRKWTEEQDKKVAHKQKGKHASYGACGGGYSYTFTPTYLGTHVLVKNAVTKETLTVRELGMD